MLKRVALAGVVFLLPLVVNVNTTSAADRQVKIKPKVDFTATVNPRLNGTTSSLGKTGVVVKIQSAAIAKDGTITVRATIVDSDGIPLDRLGVATPGPVSMSFIAAYIPAGQTQYVSYTTIGRQRHAEHQPFSDPGGQRFRRHFHHQRRG